MVRITLSVLFALFCLTLPPAAPAAAADSAPQGAWAPVAEQVSKVIDQAVDRYAAGDVAGAKKAVMHAYFGVFESSKMESAMRTRIGAKHTYAVESQFGDLRKAVTKGKSKDVVARLADNLRQALRRDAKTLDDANVPRQVFEVNK